MRTLFRNIPNILSGYRLLAVPVLAGLIFSGNKPLFVVLLCISLVTDILDGLLARLLKLQTEFGARLDSVADFGTSVMAFLGFIVLEPEFVNAQRIPLLILPVGYVLPMLIGFLRFKKWPSLHLYSAKITGYLQGVFIFTYFVFGYAPVFFWVMWSFSMLSYLEELVIIMRITQMRSNVKGIYWMLNGKGTRI